MAKGRDDIWAIRMGAAWAGGGGPDGSAAHRGFR